MAEVNFEAHGTATFTDEIGCFVTRGATGRVVETLTKEQWKCEADVLDWLNASGDDVDHQGRAQVLDGLAKLNRAPPCIAFRAREFERNGSPPTMLDFGPNPLRRRNRYNRDGEAALYLGSSLDGIRSEMKVYAQPGNDFFVATFGSIDPALRIADLTDRTLPNAVHHAFDRAEREDGESAGQRLAGLVRDFGWQGMLVPGVRGSPTNRYCNLVVFSVEDWKNWIDQESTPVRLAAD